VPTKLVETPDPAGVAKQDEPADAPLEARTTALVPVPERLPALPEQPSPPRRKRRWRTLLALALLCAGIGAGGFYWWRQHQARLPEGIVSGNGRIEAEEIDIDTKFAGRVLERYVDEGDMVTAGEVVARMDTRDLEATLRRTEAQVLQARKTLDEANANVVQQQTQVTLAQQEIERTTALVARGYATKELLDQRRQSLNGAIALLNAANARVGEAERALDAATHYVELYKVNIADNTLVSPTLGRIQYRIANVGEVLPAGGKVFTLLDISDVWMSICRPLRPAAPGLAPKRESCSTHGRSSSFRRMSPSSPRRLNSLQRRSRPRTSATSSCSASRFGSTRISCSHMPSKSERDCLAGLMCASIRRSYGPPSCKRRLPPNEPVA
jgi:HlyD family secretion protein